ncbi:uncharacterized protein [Phyllobates terribilis]|uniref:uncharacterized protein n=1 Tax=Phyllobates terribilis TaxID=111132 RepID=UPI003CCAAEBF
MVGKEDDSGSWGEYETSENNAKRFWRSASWSSSRTLLHDPVNEGKISMNVGGNGAQCRRIPPPLTPRPQPNCKGRAALPPLQPLSIARRSLEEWPRAGSDDIGEWGPLTPGGKDLSKGGERLKLDMSIIQKSSAAGMVKSDDKLISFDKACSKVAEHIYLGGEAVARDKNILKEHGITHVLNCIGFICPEYFKTDFVYKTLWLQDKVTEDITSILYDVFDYFEDVREQKGRVFVHCSQGVSRSTSLVIAYHMWREGQNFDDAFQYVKEARGIADPNMGFAWQLLQCQKRVHAFPLSPSSLLRVYRMAPHSPYDPLHLVPKVLNHPSPSVLDSRGAFIIQVPSAIFVWIGKKCEAVMERDARGAVSQIVRYEKVNAPVHVIKEGDEPSFFWDTFSDFLLEKRGDSPAKIQPGERKVSVYDIDFEIFHQAIVGGFVPPVASSSGTEHETHLPAREDSWSAMRRKFASGPMKEFVSVPKLAINKVNSSSMSASSPSWPSSSSSASSTLSSPPYLSPDSISSDSSSNSNHFSDSPLDSPTTFSPTLSSLSNLSLLSAKNSDTTSNHPGYIEVNFASQRKANSCSSSKKSQLSIAQRRGCLSKFLKLPVADDTKRKKEASGNGLSNQEDDSVILELGNKLDMLDYEDSARTGDKIDDCRSGSDDSNILAGMKPSVHSFPSLEKMSVLPACWLNPESAFVIVSSRKSDVYLWIGSSFTINQNLTNTQEGVEVGDVGLIDWNQIGSNVLLDMGLPRSTNFKIAREGEEPLELVELLRMLISELTLNILRREMLEVGGEQTWKIGKWVEDIQFGVDNLRMKCGSQFSDYFEMLKPHEAFTCYKFEF